MLFTGWTLTCQKLVLRTFREAGACSRNRGTSREEVIKVTIPLNTVFCVTPDSKGSRVEKFTLLDHPEGVVLDPASH